MMQGFLEAIGREEKEEMQRMSVAVRAAERLSDQKFKKFLKE